MKKLKFYINDESKLNEYEKENKKISYRTLVNYLFNDSLILCNDITKLFYTDINGEYIEPILEVGQDYDENDEPQDIYQYFIVDFPNFNLDFMKKYCQNEIILYYIDFLDCYILGVDHFGTMWDYVLTDFEYTTNYDESMQGQLYKD